MAVIETSQNLLYKLLGREIDFNELDEYLLDIKCEGEIEEDGKLKIEIKDFYRPDMYSTAGIVRELKGILNLEIGIPPIRVYQSNYEVIVDKEVTNIRPYIVSAVIEDIKIDDDILSDLIQFQEKVTQSFGRRRRKIAIGIHNKDLIQFPVYYKAVEPDKIKFIPLYYNEEMNLNEILEKTEAGKKYEEILNGYKKYPILIDSKGEVISFPPIINSNRIGRVDNNTKSLFLDITGTDLDTLMLTLNFFLLTLYDYGGKIYSVKITYPDFQIETPAIKILRKEFDLEKIRKRLGINLSNEEIIEYLRRKRFDAKIENNKLIVEYLNYRNDILSENDIVEEILISYGYNKLKPLKRISYIKGKLSERRKIINEVRKMLLSTSSIELYTPTLVNKEINDLIDTGISIEILNYSSSNYNSIRKNLLSSFLQLLSSSPEISLPSRLFEVGRVAYLKDGEVIEEDRVIYIYSDYKVSINNAKSILGSLFDRLKIKYEIEESNYKFLIEGRQGNIIVNDETIGWIGEINPEILEKLNIKYPLVGFEISLDKIKEYFKR